MTTWQGSEKRAQSQYIDIDDEEGEEEGIPNNHIPTRCEYVSMGRCFCHIPGIFNI